VLKLCGVAAGDVGQWWVRIYNFGVTQLLQRPNVFGVKLFKPLSAKGERAEVIFYRVEKSLRVCVSEDRVDRVIEV
jgi:hypothetical protein